MTKSEKRGKSSLGGNYLKKREPNRDKKGFFSSNFYFNEN